MMKPTAISPTIIARDLDPARQFYPTLMDGRITFDCGWYMEITFGDGPTLHFMQPQSPGQPVYQSGLTYNVKLSTREEVLAAHDRLSGAGLPMIMPLEDHPWGDHGFCTLDPYGVALYIYVETEPSAEFKQYYR